jgi:hypothetical protein
MSQPQNGTSTFSVTERDLTGMSMVGEEKSNLDGSGMAPEAIIASLAPSTSRSATARMRFIDARQ